MPPGSTYLPDASITLSACISSVVPMTAIFSSSTRTSPRYWSDAVTIVPFLISVFMMVGIVDCRLRIADKLANLQPA